MNDIRVPDLETRQRLLRNLQEARVGVAQFNLELDEIISRLERHNRQQKLQKLKQS